MIARQAALILRRQKSETRRLAREGEELVLDPGIGEILAVRHPSGRVRYQVDRSEPLILKRSWPALWWRMKDGELEILATKEEQDRAKAAMWSAPAAFVEQTGADGWQKGRIQIVRIQLEMLHDITAAGAVREGVATVAEYRALWTSINGRTPDARWEDNPPVYVLTIDPIGVAT